MSVVKKWLCIYTECRALLGFDEDNVVRIKRKDLYVEIKNAEEISVTCYKCGKRNTITKEAPEALKENSDAVRKE
jgi:RNase P subunit RPR2